MLLHLMGLVLHHGSLRGHGDLRGSDGREVVEVVQRDLTDNLGHLGPLWYLGPPVAAEECQGRDQRWT
jgi:hypothetical protein